MPNPFHTSRCPGMQGDDAEDVEMKAILQTADSAVQQELRYLSNKLKLDPKLCDKLAGINEDNPCGAFVNLQEVTTMHVRYTKMLQQLRRRAMAPDFLKISIVGDVPTHVEKSAIKIAELFQQLIFANMPLEHVLVANSTHALASAVQSRDPGAQSDMMQLLDSYPVAIKSFSNVWKSMDILEACLRVRCLYVLALAQELKLCLERMSLDDKGPYGQAVKDLGLSAFLTNIANFLNSCGDQVAAFDASQATAESWKSMWVKIFTNAQQFSTAAIEPKTEQEWAKIENELKLKHAQKSVDCVVNSVIELAEFLDEMEMVECQENPAAFTTNLKKEKKGSLIKKLANLNVCKAKKEEEQDTVTMQTAMDEFLQGGGLTNEAVAHGFGETLMLELQKSATHILVEHTLDKLVRITDKTCLAHYKALEVAHQFEKAMHTANMRVPFNESFPRLPDVGMNQVVVSNLEPGKPSKLEFKLDSSEPSLLRLYFVGSVLAVPLDAKPIARSTRMFVGTATIHDRGFNFFVCPAVCSEHVQSASYVAAWSIKRTVDKVVLPTMSVAAAKFVLNVEGLDFIPFRDNHGPQSPHPT